MVEFALVLPVALLLIFGLLEFGRVVNAEISAGHCANELARYGAIGGRTVAQVRDFAYHTPVCPTFNLETTGTTVIQVDVLYPTGQATGTGIVVSITYPVEIVAPGLRSLFPGDGGICAAGYFCAHGRAVMERESAGG
jgi:Flp pilus assembly protein TadG